MSAWNPRALALLLALALLPSAGAVAGTLEDPPVFRTSNDCAAAWQRYRNATTPFHFAQTQDGRTCAYSLCIGRCKSSRDPREALHMCEVAAEGRSCEIYAFRGSIVSKGTVKPGGGAGN